MIDTVTFKKMHPDPEGRSTANRDELGDKYLTQEDPSLGDEFFMCLPSTITGFNMQRKEWGMDYTPKVVILLQS